MFGTPLPHTLGGRSCTEPGPRGNVLQKARYKLPRVCGCASVVQRALTHYHDELGSPPSAPQPASDLILGRAQRTRLPTTCCNTFFLPSRQLRPSTNGEEERRTECSCPGFPRKKGATLSRRRLTAGRSIPSPPHTRRCGGLCSSPPPRHEHAQSPPPFPSRFLPPLHQRPKRAGEKVTRVRETRKIQTRSRTRARKAHQARQTSGGV